MVEDEDRMEYDGEDVVLLGLLYLQYPRDPSSLSEGDWRLFM